MSAYLTFGLWFAAILGFVAMMLIANARLGPKPQSNAVKLEAFERGAKPVDPHKVKAVSIK
jgi:NADH:ubiquinone oxidoreductase subunit 3 (subunit A)